MKITSRLICRAGVLAGVMAVAGFTFTGHAAVMTYSDRSAFDAAVSAFDGTQQLETFESEAIRTITDLDVMIESGLRIWSGTPNWVVDVTNEEAFSYNTTPGGSQHVRFAFGGSGDFTAVFRTPTLTNGFGFDLTGFQDTQGLGGFELELWSQESMVETVFIESPGTFFDRFHGITSDQAFDTVVIRILGGDFVGFDDITFLMIPASGAMPLLLAGFFGGRRRRA